MGKRIRAVIVALVTICLCLALLLGATYALFSDCFTVNNHLQAGTLQVGLERIGYQSRELDETNGMLVVGEKDTTVVDLVDDTSVLFDVNTIVPGCWYEAEIRVRNFGDVAFDYGVRILWNEDNDAEALELALADQIRITISAGGVQKGQFMLDDAVDIDLGAFYAGGDAQTFTVRAEFTDNSNNNAAQNAGLEFDLQVYALQKTNA